MPQANTQQLTDEFCIQDIQLKESFIQLMVQPFARGTQIEKGWVYGGVGLDRNLIVYTT